MMKLMFGSFVFVALVAVIAGHCHDHDEGLKGFEGIPTVAHMKHCGANFCQGAGDVILVPAGDVNGDGFDDLVCHKGSGQIEVALNTHDGGFHCDHTPAEGIPKGWCVGKKDKAFLADFDGDMIADLLCHSYLNGAKDVRLRSSKGNSYSNPTNEGLTGWCYHASAELHVADFDGDRKADLLCHDNKTGYKWLAKGQMPDQKLGFVRKQERGFGWCFHSSSILYVADSNDDKSADIFCHDNAGTTWIIKSAKCTNAAACTTQFKTPDHGLQARRGFCGGNTLAPMPKYHLIDFNGDGKADQYCHRTGPKENNCVLTGGSTGFSANEKCAWESDADYCNKKGDLLIFGRFFGTKRDDILCIRGRTYLFVENYGL